MSSTIQQPYPQWQDPIRGGRSIALGFVYVGQPDTDPTSDENQLQVFYLDENQQKVNLQQPLRTNSNGFFVISESNSTVIQARVDENNYSVTAQDKNRVDRWVVKNASEVSPAFEITLQEILNLTEPSNLNLVTRRERTQAEAVAENAAIGTRYYITDLDSNFIVDTGLTPDGFIIIEISASKQLRRESFPTQTKDEQIWYVDASATGMQDGTQANPFATPQQAIAAMPTIAMDQQVISLAAGTYNLSSIPSSEQPRPAVIWVNGKVTTFRSTLSSGVITAPILIKGATGTASDVIIETTADLPYGIYVNKGNIGIQDLTIRGGTADAESLLTAHRTDTYVQCENVVFDGQSGNASNGVIAESNGQIELANECLVTGSAINVRTQTDGDNIIVSGNSTITNATDKNIQVEKGNIKIQLTIDSGDVTMVSGGANPVFVGANASLEIRGKSASSRATCSDQIESISGKIELVLARITNVIEVQAGSSIYINSTVVTRNVRVEASLIQLNDATIVSTDPNSIILLGDSLIWKEGNNNLTPRRETRNVVQLQFGANGVTNNLSLGSRRYYIRPTNGASRTGCIINADALSIGDTVEFVNTDPSFDLEIIDNPNGRFDVGGSITVGPSSGSYSGFTGFIDDSGVFNISGVGKQVP